MANLISERQEARLLDQLDELRSGKRECVWLSTKKVGEDTAEAALKAALRTSAMKLGDFPVFVGKVPVKPNWSGRYAYTHKAGDFDKPAENGKPKAKAKAKPKAEPKPIIDAEVGQRVRRQGDRRVYVVVKPLYEQKNGKEVVDVRDSDKRMHTFIGESLRIA